MANYLLEIGTEELPADHVPEAQERLKSLLCQALEQSSLAREDIVAFGTPRRLACIVKALAAVQATTQRKVKGPPVKASFDDQGRPLPAAVGFAQKQAVRLEDLDREEVGGTVYLVANLTVKGRPAQEVLKEIVPQVISQISGERLMRWGSSDLKFSRPIRWLVSLLDDEEVVIKLDGLVSGRESYGHRILAPGRITIASPDSYVDALRAAYVLVDPGERRRVIAEAVEHAAGTVSGRARQLKGALLEEVVNITEWPCAILGTFAEEYLDLPEALIETVMVHHQRYFPVERRNDTCSTGSRLIPYFVSVANNDRAEAAAVIKRGNERVLKARLADGRFFFFDDQRIKLADRKAALAQLTFHEGLGSYLDKQERMVQTARALADALRLEPRLGVCLERTMELCKIDLVTNLVRELPELQGFVGSWYAQREGEPPDVVAAIASHYSPRSTEDSIPADTVGCLAAVVDKLDNLVGLYALGKRPTGSSDPYVIRRQAQGLIDILVEGLAFYHVSVSALIERLVGLYENWLAKAAGKANAAKGLEDLREFLIGRLKTKLIDRGFCREVVEAVLAAGDPLSDIPDVVTRSEVLQDLIEKAGGLDLVRAGVRVGNILTAQSPDVVNGDLFSDRSERELWDAFTRHVAQVWEEDGTFRAPSSKEEYVRVLALLDSIVSPIDNLFDRVMINDPDLRLRDNRHGLLKQVDRYFRSIADFPKMQPLLP